MVSDRYISQKRCRSIHREKKMTVSEFRSAMAQTKYIAAGSELHLAFHAYSQEALQITAALNSSYHTPEAMRELMADLTAGDSRRRRGGHQGCAAAHRRRRCPGKDHQVRLRGKTIASRQGRNETAMKSISKIFTVALAAAVLCGCATRITDSNPQDEAELPRLEALVFDSDGSAIYGQILVPSPRFGNKRPCAIICHGFAGFTRWDDVAHDLCRAGIIVLIPHHRGAWGSEGEYTVSGCIRDAENLANWVMSSDFSEKYGADATSVYLVGHSMGGNSAVNAAARVKNVRGVALIAPCDIGFMASKMPKLEMLSFLRGEGLDVLHRASDDALVDDIYANAAEMIFTNACASLGDRKVFLATGQYDSTVPAPPLDSFWTALPQNPNFHLRKTYPCGHSMMGCRTELAAALAGFILKK